MIRLKLILLLAAFVVAGGLQEAEAMNYAATHLLLVFRKDGAKDSEFDLGTVSNFLGLANGTVVPVSYPTQVKTNYNNSFSGVNIALLAATTSTDNPLHAWMTDADLVDTPLDLTLSKFSTIRSKIDGVGAAATEVTVSNAAPYIVSASDATAYSYIVTGGTLSSIGTFAGDSPFIVEAANPATLDFYDVRPSNSPHPPAQLIGTFNWDVSGNLTFTAAGATQTPLSPSLITGVTRSNGVTTVSFTTTNGLNYSLYSSTSVTGGWSQVAGPIAGNNNNTNFTHTAADSTRFYRIQTSQ